ncbi:unnamed protein product, partial [Pocillopora meandrina]
LYFCLHVTKGRGVVRQTLCDALQRSEANGTRFAPATKIKERGDLWNHIAINLNGFDHPKFQVNKRSTRDRLTLLITKNKTDMRQEENASRIAWEETELDQALKEIIDKEKLVNEKGSEAKKKEKEEKAAAEELRKTAMERLGHTQKRNSEGESDRAQAKKSRRRSFDVVP